VSISATFFRKASALMGKYESWWMATTLRLRFCDNRELQEKVFDDLIYISYLF